MWKELCGLGCQKSTDGSIIAPVIMGGMSAAMGTHSYLRFKTATGGHTNVYATFFSFCFLPPGDVTCVTGFFNFKLCSIFLTLSFIFPNLCSPVLILCLLIYRRWEDSRLRLGIRFEGAGGGAVSAGTSRESEEGGEISRFVFLFIFL